MKLVMGKETVIVQGIRPEEELWGSYQFPAPYHTKDGIVVSVHVADDDISNFRQDTKRWFKSKDNGETWEEVDTSVSAECGLLLPNGDRLFFPQVGSTDLGDYEFTHMHYRTPGTDMEQKSEEGVIPVQDGLTFDMHGTVIMGYNADRLPDSLSKKEWLSLRIPNGSDEAKEEYVKLDWPYLTRVVYIKDDKKTMRPVFPHGRSKIGPDGAIWTSTYSGDGHINPENGLYSPYYSSEIFRSEDNGHTFKLYAHMEYPADGSAEYPYLSGGFSDNDFEFMPDGSIVWFLRSAWFARTGYEWSPMYMSRSVDMGKTWSKPVPFAPTGIFPSMCKLTNGTTLLCYARPGIFVTGTEDDSGTKWCEPLEVMTPGDRSRLANIPAEKVRFHDWDGACNNPQLLALDDNSALIFYSDFYYPDEQGVKRKSILCRKITIEE